MVTKQELIAFEQTVAAEYNAGKIRAPVHLSAGNEDQLIEIFKQVKPHDYVFSTWRSHYHALLHGVPRDELMAKVLKGESITICMPECRFYSSAICGGNLPIALGMAWSVKHEKDSELARFEMGAAYKDRPHIWCFVGDMAAEMGSFAECTRYAANHDLPITYVVEDNSMCVNTPTREVWGGVAENEEVERWNFTELVDCGTRPTIIRYRYKLGWPHMGSGKWIDFGSKKLAPSGGM